MSAAGAVVWLTGRPASGKSTIAEALVTALEARGDAAVWLDSDVLRHILTPQPTYSADERDAFYRALAQLAALLARGRVTVVVSATAHRKAWRALARSLCPRFSEVWVRCDDQVLRRRDPKGLYARVDRGEISGLPGVDLDYEAPDAPELIIEGADEGAEPAAARILALLDRA